MATPIVAQRGKFVGGKVEFEECSLDFCGEGRDGEKWRVYLEIEG